MQSDEEYLKAVEIRAIWADDLVSSFHLNSIYRTAQISIIKE